MQTNSLVPATPKRLSRSRDNAMLAGVCGGIGAYLRVDPTVVRVAYALLTIVTGVVPGLLVYLVLMFLIPREQQPASSALGRV